MSITCGLIGITSQMLEDFLMHPTKVGSFVNETIRDIDLEYFSLDKTWQALQYLLTNGDDAELNNILAKAIMGGTSIGEHFVYEPIRYLLSSEVQEVVKSLMKITEADIKQRFNPQVMESIYIGWTINDLPVLLDYFEKLVEFYNVLAKKNMAVLIFLL